MARHTWTCETCQQPHSSLINIWECPSCRHECCEKCFDRYAHCRPCAKGKTNAELRRVANLAGFDFEEPLCDCIVSGNALKPKQHGADPHAKNCTVYA